VQQIAAYSHDDYSMTSLRNAQFLTAQHKFLRLRRIEKITRTLRGNGDKLVLMLGVVRSQCEPGMPQIVENPFEEGLVGVSRRQDSLNVFHDECGGGVLSDESEVFPVQEMAVISLEPGRVRPTHSGTTH
jgi:hypothetical protein